MYSTKSFRPCAFEAASATTLTFQVVGIVSALAEGAKVTIATATARKPARPVNRLIISSFSLAAPRHALARIDVRFVARAGQNFLKADARSAETTQLHVPSFSRLPRLNGPEM